MPPSYSAEWTFVSPSNDFFDLSLTSVDAHLYPLTNGARVCVRAAEAALVDGPSGSCIATGSVDQRSGIRDGRWQRALTAVALRRNVSYAFVISMDQRRGGFVAADALLVESHRLYNGNGAGARSSAVVVGAMDSRILLK